MGVVEEKINDLKAREAKILQMGGEKAVAKHHEKGKLTARERLNLLFDERTFREIDMFVRHRCVNFDMANVEIPSDGVVTGHGMVGGRCGIITYKPMTLIDEHIGVYTIQLYLYTITSDHSPP